MMRVRKATNLALTLFLAAGLGVFASTAQAKAAAPKKAASSKASSASHGKRSRRSSRRERGQKAPTSERISEIQQALAKDGSFAGNPNGKWDDATVEAMRKFQTRNGLNPNGKLDALTLQKLGLGSKTAGVAAPIPVSTSLNATPAAQTTSQQQQ